MIARHPEGYGCRPVDGRLVARGRRTVLQSEMTRSVPGTGLGLTLVRQAAEGCGGRVRVEDAGDGGARFRLEFRVAVV